MKELSKNQINKLRKKVWNNKTVKNPFAKEMLQGDGRYGAKVIDKQKENVRKPKYGNKEWLNELDELDELLDEANKTN